MATAEGDKYRSFIYGEGEKNTQWRFGAPPNYDVVNKLFEQGRTHEWPVGSREERVQRLIKSMEMELVHKINPADFKSINAEKFRLSVNGAQGITPEEIRRIGGSYNAFLRTNLPPELRYYDPARETAESSTTAFTTTFPRGFALEILQVYSGPPTIVYKFRHWGFMQGPFKGHAPTGEKAEFFGIGVAQVDEAMRIENLDFFYDGGELIAGLVKGTTTKKIEVEWWRKHMQRNLLERRNPHAANTIPPPLQKVSNLRLEKTDGGQGRSSSLTSGVHRFSSLAKEMESKSDKQVHSIPCQCGKGDAVVRISRTKKNPGRAFYCCPLGVNKSCGFFAWVDEALICPSGKGFCRRRTSTTTNSRGRVFYVCPFSKAGEPTARCGFFKWADDMKDAPMTGSSSSSTHAAMDLKQDLQKEKYAAETVAALCDRLLLKMEKVGLSEKDL